MKYSLSGQVKLSMALVVIGTANLTMASITDKTDARCEAALTAKFTESAPRDRFSFVNTSSAAWSVKNITVELASAKGNLVFDTQRGGAGVEVFQPYRLESTSAEVADVQIPDDGGQTITIRFDKFPAGADYVFSIDIDDQLTDSSLGNIRVTGGELTGTTVMAEFVSDTGARETQTASFKADYKTNLMAACT